MPHSLYENIIQGKSCTLTIANLIIKDYTSKSKRDPTAPFQFTLPLMAAMYCDICDSKYTEHFSEKIYKMALNGEKIDYRGTKVNIAQALKSPIRAIAYFSWENSSRMFLARRVFPYYFNFLSYSHCPEGWGALGMLLEEMEKNDSNINDVIPHEVREFSQKALPFLAEVKRLRYSSIFTIPIVDSKCVDSDSRFTANNLRGAFVFFVNDNTSLPGTVLEEKIAVFKSWIRELNAKMNDCLDHNAREEYLRIPVDESETINSTSQQESVIKTLADVWKEYSADSRYHKTIEIEKITIKPKSKGEVLDLEKICSVIIARLSGSEYHAIIDNIDESNEATILVAGSGSTNIKPEVLRAVGEACPKDKCIIVELSDLCQDSVTSVHK